MADIRNEFGRITDEGVADLRRRVGSYYAGGSSVEINPELLIRYAIGMGTHNSLYRDAAYANASVHGSLVAFPTFLNAVKHTSGTPVGGLPGVQSFHGGNRWRWYRHVRPGDVISATYRPSEILEKPSSYAGRMVIVYADVIYMNQDHQLVGRAGGWSIRTERGAAREKGKYSSVKKESYSAEDLERVWAAYDGERVRGDEPRYWENVAVGDKLPPLTKGPLRIIDIGLSGGVGGGSGPVGRGAGGEGSHYYMFQAYRDHPGYSEPDPETGMPDHPHRGHWEDLMSQLIGVPGAYDVGPQRAAWMAEVVVNWMGDRAFLAELDCEFRRFNIEGDTTTVGGTVTDRGVAGDQHFVDIEIECQNQRGEVHAPGRARAILPTKSGEGVVPG
ncbi:MAG: acyl dehydratase [Dehalococcoidia bacterium]|nr:acyl dehydratase [Dehalococcoidia bacterium]